MTYGAPKKDALCLAQAVTQRGPFVDSHRHGAPKGQQVFVYVLLLVVSAVEGSRDEGACLDCKGIGRV